jgi:hypothetical protein
MAISLKRSVAQQIFEAVARVTRGVSWTDKESRCRVGKSEQWRKRDINHAEHRNEHGYERRCPASTGRAWEQLTADHDQQRADDRIAREGPRTQPFTAGERRAEDENRQRDCRPGRVREARRTLEIATHRTACWLAMLDPVTQPQPTHGAHGSRARSKHRNNGDHDE